MCFEKKKCFKSFVENMFNISDEAHQQRRNSFWPILSHFSSHLKWKFILNRHFRSVACYIAFTGLIFRVTKICHTVNVVPTLRDFGPVKQRKKITRNEWMRGRWKLRFRNCIDLTLLRENGGRPLSKKAPSTLEIFILTTKLRTRGPWRVNPALTIKNHYQDFLKTTLLLDA